MNIDTIYQDLIEPSVFINNFTSEDEFKQWLIMGTKEDLQHTLKAFEKAEMYEQCITINNMINSKYKNSRNYGKRC